MENFQPFRFPAIPGIEKIATDFWQDTKGRDVECLLAVNKDGVITAASGGDATTVQVPEGARGCFILHSHPKLPAPLSMPDVCVINTFNLLGNMAVCSDGTLSWTSGCVTPGNEGANALYHFSEQPKFAWAAQLLMTATKGNADISDVCVSWLMLKELFEIGGLKDFQFRAGSDLSALKFLEKHGFKPPQQFSLLH